MLSRYIGNKRVMLTEILDAVGNRVDPGGLVCDAFSGSLAVSLALKRAGYRVAANDINLFSSVYGRAFLTNSAIPPVDFDAVLPNDGHVRLLVRAKHAMDQYEHLPGYSYLAQERNRDQANRLMALLLFLQDGPDRRFLPPDFARSDIFDHYCEAGASSAFRSQRGTTGRRRFFSAENARHIDSILNYLRYWHTAGLVSPTTEAVLLTALLDAVERVANTQGTYHDFPRQQYDARALKPMRLILPAFDGLIGRRKKHFLGTELDSREFVTQVPSHEALYIDPPYNFRQYTSYYFLPNLLCRYPTLADPDAYFGAIQYVRGQNMSDDFVSTFSKSNSFLESLRTLIERARTKTVLLSYFDGRNHWNDFKAAPNGEGLRRLSEFFGDSALFNTSSFEILPVKRMNYQSYGGHRAREVLEYLFVAEKL
jgi:adenine-specific DNA-methyltransferase